MGAQHNQIAGWYVGELVDRRDELVVRIAENRIIDGYEDLMGAQPQLAR